MIVYGDPQYTTSMATLIERLAGRCVWMDHDSVDGFRELLIRAGELEQACEDGGLGGRYLSETTNLAADAFTASHLDQDWAKAHERWSMMGNTMGLLHRSPKLLNVKVPEGFAFYSLFPEQYAQAALRWAREHPEAQRILVVGIRSIGTTLSAVVTSVLEREDRVCDRVTLRPSGHPFHRQCALSSAYEGGPEWGLVVDEGPGLSGSSMAAAAGALMRVGVPVKRIAFLPGHAGEPGSAASDEVRAWWSQVPRYVTPLEELRWEGQSLPEILAARTAEWSGARVTAVENLSGGLWRRTVYGDGEWPSAVAPFERQKLRCVLADGRSILWKFAGLHSAADSSLSAAEATLREVHARAEAGWTVAPLGAAAGFVAVPWVEGRALTIGDRTEKLLKHIGRYLAAVAGPELSAEEWEASHSRLRELLYWNTHESLGQEAAERTRRYADAAQGAAEALRSGRYGDGRLGPAEWRYTEAGRLVKVNAGPHDVDHTAVGIQPLAWDVAGALVEWRVEKLPEMPAIPAEALAFYRMGYAAFRMGQCVLCAGMAEADERRRLEQNAARYRTELVRLLGV